MHSSINDEPIYHTDCMFVFLDKHAVFCTECVTDKKERENVIRELTDSSLNPSHTFDVLEIKTEHVLKMCANMQILVDS